MTLKKILLLLLLTFVVIASYLTWEVFGPTIHNTEKKFLYIKTNSNYQQVKDSLISNKIFKGSFIFDKIANYVDYPQNIKPGKYKIENNSSLYNLVKNLRQGRQVPVNLVITKLRTKEDLAKRIALNFEVDSITAIQFLSNNEALNKYDVDTNTVLTKVIPNTYTYYWTTPIELIYEKLFTEHKRFWNTKRLQQAKKINLTPKEIYTLASIVEEETNKQEDKGKIASVYVNRMKKGMRLAADPTVKFAMKDFELKRIYHKHLAFESPFNTYLNSGLPPGPICTPSIKTIDAVLDMPTTDFLFFVARADFSGYSNFANNYQQHLAFAKEYQRALDSLILSKQSKIDSLQ